MIKKFNYKTPGRESDDEETRLYTRKDVNERAAKKSDDGEGTFDERSAMILKGLGGKENIRDIDCCATRLRVTVRDGGRVNDGMLRSSGASGVIRKGDGVQIIYGPQVSVVKSAFDDFLDSDASDRIEELLPNIDMNVTAQGNNAEKNGGNSTERTALSLYAHMSGRVIPLSEVEDEAFSQKILGDGVAVEPSLGELYAPCDARVEAVTDTGHAINLVAADGCEILLHVGIDTVKLGGKFFDVRVRKGNEVRKGELLMTFDAEKIRKEGYKLTTPMVICNSDDYSEIKPTASGKVSAGDKILEIR
jgi:PTS system D-glucosamine-specific IIC component